MLHDVEMRSRRASVGGAALASAAALAGMIGLDITAAADDDPKVLFVRGADRSGGFLEASTDQARTEQLADITNGSTSSGNHGWATLAATLRAAGFDVEQVLEGAEQSGPTAGQPVDLDSIGLGAYDVVVFGSNNAEYTTAHVDALDTYVRGGGAALFISDANFGGSWQDAPNSDQQFLGRYGIVVHQDAGTYRIDADEFVSPTHPVLAGVTAFDGEGVSPFDIGAATVDVTVLARAESQVRVNPGDRQGPTRSAGSNDVVSWVADVGDGRIAGHYDRNTFFNANGAGTNIGRFANERYAVNLFTWLAADGSTTAPTTTAPTTTVPTSRAGVINDAVSVDSTTRQAARVGPVAQVD